MLQYTLSNGIQIPALGFGCFNLPQDSGREVILNAIRVGYRHFDTASVYQTEAALGQAIRDSGLPREEFFITSKVWRTQMDSPREAFESSLKALQTNYLDLYLIHWPRPDLERTDWAELDIRVWHCLEEQYQKGLVRAIGVSNFLPHHLMNLFDHCTIRPMVDQLEYPPGYIQEAAVNYCKSNGIQVEAWSPVGRMKLKDDPQIVAMAEQYHVTVPQLCLRFAVQNQVIPLPKSSDPGRMTQNLDLFGFELSQEDMARIRTLPQLAWLGEHPDRERVRID
ncbi:MAG: aldo/keto reductase [Lawsonibacter sp.]|nr:aldo/keto reductase [Lawsonibacter sp.]